MAGYILKSLQTGRPWSDLDGHTVVFPSYDAAAAARDSVPSGILYGAPVTTEIHSEHPCSFCGGLVPFQRVYDAESPFWGLQAMDSGAGSDHLAIWCADCGPLHRST